jgi:hypothetical protein
MTVVSDLLPTDACSGDISIHVDADGDLSGEGNVTCGILASIIGDIPFSLSGFMGDGWVEGTLTFEMAGTCALPFDGPAEWFAIEAEFEGDCEPLPGFAGEVSGSFEASP